MLTTYAQQTMVDALPIGAAIFIGPELIIGAVNQQMLAIWSKDRSVIGMLLADAIPEIREQGFTELLTDVYHTGEEYRNPDGKAELLNDNHPETKYFDFSFKPLKDADGKIYGIVNTAVDTTERVLYAEQLQQANEELQASGEELKNAYDELNQLHDQLTITEQKARLLLESAPAAIGVINANDYTIDSANALLLKLWDTDSSAVGQSIEAILPQQENELLTKILTEIKSQGKPLHGEDVKFVTGKTNEAHPSYFNFVYQPVKNRAGEVVSVQIVANEVTDQRNAKMIADYSLAQLNLAKKAAHIGVFDLDVVNDQLYWDENCRKIFGVDQTKEVGYASDFSAGLHPDDRAKTLQAVEEAYDQQLTGGTFNVEYRVIDATNGQVCWVRAVGQVYFNEQSEPQRFIGTVVNITDAVEARQKLEENEKQLQDFNEELTAINEELNAVNEEYQVTNEELISTNEELQAIQEERDKLHQELIIKEERLRFAMKAAEVGTWDLDVANNLVRWDERCKELYGFSKNDVVPYEQVLRYMHPDDMPAVNEAVRQALDPSANGSYDIRFRTIGAEDGRVRWLHCCGKAFFGEDGRAYRFSGIAQDVTETHLLQQEVDNTKNNLKFAVEAANFGTWHVDTQTRKMFANDRLKELFGISITEEITVAECLANIPENYRESVKGSVEHAIVNGGNYDISHPICVKDKDSLRWVRAVGNLKADEKGDYSAFTGVVLDITAQKQEEQRRSDFIGIVSHELRSPLTSLNGYVQMLGMKAKKTEDQFALDTIAKAKRQVDKMSALITGFLDVARIGEGKIKLNLKTFDMAELVKAAEEESLATITSHKVIFHPVLFTLVKADQDKIEQVLVNLINNAVKYSPAGSTINVACITRDGKAHVSVTDEGMGIPAKDLPHIFNRFYRVESEQTKLTKGFGIGLFISKDIIESHGGQIGVESLEGKGSTFWFELPVALQA